MPSSTAENYLKAVWGLTEQSGGMTTVSALAEALDLTRGTVTTMSKSLAAQGLLEHLPREGIRLSSKGRSAALTVLRKHRLVETFLVGVLKMDWSEVHEEAEALEHSISERVLDRLDDFLGRPAVDPHGDPIPSRKGQIDTRGERVTLADCAPQKPVQVVRINDQSPQFLEYVQKIGLKPGTRLRVLNQDKTGGFVRCNLEADKDAVLGMPEAGKIEVRAAG